ncbi:hypothetical protein, partial [Algoriphagus boritolerans]|uniref:hypothetical protein n=1 Tax=Algoriphagus boritolerans TaxID=308111 RepID=UPI002FCE3B19
MLKAERIPLGFFLWIWMILIIGLGIVRPSPNHFAHRNCRFWVSDFPNSHSHAHNHPTVLGETSLSDLNQGKIEMWRARWADVAAGR